MTLKEMQQKLEEQQSKLAVASDMNTQLNRFLSNFYSYERDENGDTKYDEDYNPVIDLTQPTWDEERAKQALALHDYLQEAMMKWIAK